MEGRPIIDHRRRARCIPSDEAEFAVFVDAALGGLASEGDRDVVAFLQDRVRDLADRLWADRDVARWTLTRQR
jgi:hypothetical protein